MAVTTLRTSDFIERVVYAGKEIENGGTNYSKVYI